MNSIKIHLFFYLSKQHHLVRIRFNDIVKCIIAIENKIVMYVWGTNLMIGTSNDNIIYNIIEIWTGFSEFQNFINFNRVKWKYNYILNANTK